MDNGGLLGFLLIPVGLAVLVGVVIVALMIFVAAHLAFTTLLGAVLDALRARFRRVSRKRAGTHDGEPHDVAQGRLR